MTKEEIRQEAEERVNICTPYHTGSFIQGYIAGAEPRENKIADNKEERNKLCADFENMKATLESKIAELQELKETLAQTIENDEVTYETLKLHDQEEIGMLNSKIAELEQQIEKLKADLNEAIEDANRWEETETFSVLNRIYNDNFEVITSVSN